MHINIRWIMQRSNPKPIEFIVGLATSLLNKAMSRTSTIYGTNVLVITLTQEGKCKATTDKENQMILCNANDDTGYDEGSHFGKTS